MKSGYSVIFLTFLITGILSMGLFPAAYCFAEEPEMKPKPSISLGVDILNIIALAPAADIYFEAALTDYFSIEAGLAYFSDFHGLIDDLHPSVGMKFYLTRWSFSGLWVSLAYKPMIGLGVIKYFQNIARLSVGYTISVDNESGIYLEPSLGSSLYLPFENDPASQTFLIPSLNLRMGFIF
ncbi:MAG: hypothetical protein HPY53_07870 [Brevinematales bacterium]|nr:hypothetical protein [Brevinematales bacterium]